MRRATAAGVHAHVGVEQVTDEIVFDLEVALVHVRHPRKRVHVLDHLAFGVVNNFAVVVPEGEAVDVFELAAFGDLLAGEIKFLAAHPINRGRSFERLGGKHGRVRTIPMPNWVKVAIDTWTEAAGVAEGHIEPAETLKRPHDSELRMVRPGHVGADV